MIVRNAKHFLFVIKYFPAVNLPNDASAISQIGPIYKGMEPIVVITMKMSTITFRMLSLGKDNRMLTATLPSASMNKRRNTIPIKA